MQAHAPITAVLVAYNSETVIADSLAALLKTPAIAEIIVVDNCSHDATCELIRNQFPSVTLIENPRNAGFGRANNIALERVKTPFALLVNPDAVVEVGAVETFLEAAAIYPDAAILAPTLYDSDGNIHQSFKRNVFNREKNSGIYTPPEGACCAEFLSGAAWLLNMAHMKHIGFFDPNIFLFYEDDDLCIRARRAGYGLVFVPGAKVKHAMGTSSGSSKPGSEFFKQAHMFWSRLYVEFKYFGMKAAKKRARLLYIECALKAFLYTLVGNKAKTNRYRGRLQGIKAFSVSPGSAPKL